MLKTSNIFIDTETFVSNSYFNNDNLKKLAEFGHSGIVKLFMTEITIKEIQSNIKEELLTTINEINTFRKSIYKKGRIIRNIDEYKVYFDLPDINFNIDFEKINIQLEKFISHGKVQIIPFDTADLSSILEKYFNKEKPFGVGKKKYEFPDAIVLSAIEKWCEKFKRKIYVLSGDTDIKEYVSRSLIPISKLRQVLDLIIRHENDKLNRIDKIFKNSEEKLIDSIKTKFKEKLYDKDYYDLSMSSLEVNDVILYDYSITNQDEDETILELDVDIEFSAFIRYNDYSFSSYDKEDGKWLFKEPRNELKIFGTTQTAEVVIECDFGNDEDEGEIYCSYITIPDSDKITEELDGYQSE
jgi:hypothetical protein